MSASLVSDVALQTDLWRDTWFSDAAVCLVEGAADDAGSLVSVRDVSRPRDAWREYWNAIALLTSDVVMHGRAARAIDTRPRDVSPAALWVHVALRDDDADAWERARLAAPRGALEKLLDDWPYDFEPGLPYRRRCASFGMPVGVADWFDWDAELSGLMVADVTGQRAGVRRMLEATPGGYHEVWQGIYWMLGPEVLGEDLVPWVVRRGWGWRWWSDDLAVSEAFRGAVGDELTGPVRNWDRVFRSAPTDHDRWWFWRECVEPMAPWSPLREDSGTPSRELATRWASLARSWSETFTLGRFRTYLRRSADEWESAARME